MEKKGTYEVELIANGQKQLFEIGHAERLLKWQEAKNTPREKGWSLPKDSKFQFDPINGITIRTNKKTTQGTETKPEPSESDKS